MSYEHKSIHEIIKDIDAGKFYLPALQRKFVWDEDRITLLFDSVLRGYPISTFLFWFLKKEKANEYVFYKFLDRYDQRDPYNKRKDGSFTQEEIIGVLDGQQRLSSIYIGLQGKYITKQKYKHFDNPDAWPERELYINLLNTPYTLDESGDYTQVVIEESENFDLRFLKEEDTGSKVGSGKNSGTFEYWYKVGNLVRWNEDISPSDVYEDILRKEGKDQVLKQLERQRRFVVKTIENLRDKFIKEQVITYFKTSKEDLEAILNIFVRVNSGAVTLSKSDLLFSTIIATWENGREEIEKLQKDLNSTGDSFGFSNDFIMRSLLVLSDLPVVFNVKSFKANNVKLIKNNWEGIRDALLNTVEILAEAGLSGGLIPSQNAVIPIAYHIYKGGELSQESKAGLLKYLKHAFLKNIYGSQSDGVITSIRKAMRAQSDEATTDLRNEVFSFDRFVDRLSLPGDKSLLISEDDLDEFLETKKGTYTFLLLSTIYPHFKYGQVKLHQDHVHPYSSFNNDIFDEWGFDESRKREWLDKRDMLPNLQLMEGGENQSKNAKPFERWLYETFPNENGDGKKREAYMERNFIDRRISLKFEDFEAFFKDRREKVKAALKEALKLKSSYESKN